jgi:arsenate reductase-like glutaredoxin family protein
LRAGIEFSERDFFKERFTLDELQALLKGESPKTVFNFKSVAFKNNVLSEDVLSDAQLLEMLIQEPRYFRRPLAVIDGQLRAGTNAKRLGTELGFEVSK